MEQTKTNKHSALMVLLLLNVLLMTVYVFLQQVLGTGMFAPASIIDYSVDSSSYSSSDDYTMPTMDYASSAYSVPSMEYASSSMPEMNYASSMQAVETMEYASSAYSLPSMDYASSAYAPAMEYGSSAAAQ